MHHLFNQNKLLAHPQQSICTPRYFAFSPSFIIFFVCGQLFWGSGTSWAVNCFQRLLRGQQGLSTQQAGPTKQHAASPGITVTLQNHDSLSGQLIVRQNLCHSIGFV